MLYYRMTNKIIVENFNADDQVVSIQQFKSLHALHKAYPKYEYHQLRQVYLKTNEKDKASKSLKKNSNIKMKIYDYDNYSNAYDKELLSIGPIYNINHKP